MKISNICVYGMYPAILKARNSYKSTDKSDSEGYAFIWNEDKSCISYNHCIIGQKDEKLIKTLLKSPSERKFLRQIMVGMDIKGSIKFWRQLDAYKIGTVGDSESTMHCITKGKIMQDDFERGINQEQIKYINHLIDMYNTKKDLKHRTDEELKDIFEWIDANLPAGYLLESYWTANYEVMRNIYHSRLHHKMYWWKEFCSYTEKLPYFELLIKNV